VSRRTWEHHRRFIAFAYGAFTVYGRPFQVVQLAMNFVTPWEIADPPVWVPRPRPHNARQL
jgi:hypothetical protein